MMTCQLIHLFLKKWIMFRKFIRGKDLQFILFYLYRICKFNNPTTCGQLLLWFNYFLKNKKN